MNNADTDWVPTGFDADLYLATNPDVARAMNEGAIASAQAHWALFGQKETAAGERPTLLELPITKPRIIDGDGDVALLTQHVDVASYIALNSDVRTLLGEGAHIVRDHWLRHGAAEGRPGFGGYAPWDRAWSRDVRRMPQLRRGCEIFIEADILAGDEAIIGRRMLASLRASGFPLSIQAYTHKDGRLVLDQRPETNRSPFAITLLVGSPGSCRRILAAFDPSHFVGRTLIACFARAPIRRHMPDWLLLSTLDAVLIPSWSEASLLSVVSPVPVIPFSLLPMPLEDRQRARERLGLEAKDVIAFAESPNEKDGSGLVDVRISRAGHEQTHTLALDDVFDPLTGTSRLLAACDHFEPAHRGSSILRVDALTSGRLIGDDVQTVYEASKNLSSILENVRSTVRGPFALPIPRLPGHTTTPMDLPVISILADLSESSLEDLTLIVHRLLDQDWGFVELCALVSSSVGAEVRSDSFVGFTDPRIRLHVGTESAPTTSLSLASGTHLLPVFCPDHALDLIAAVNLIGRRLLDPGAPDVILAASTKEEMESERTLYPLALRSRIESTVTWPLAIARAAFDAALASISLVSWFADGYALTLALLRSNASFGIIDLPKTLNVGKWSSGNERALRRHLATIYGPAAYVEPGLTSDSYRPRLSRHLDLTPQVVRASAIWPSTGFLSGIDREYVLLVSDNVRELDQMCLRTLAEMLVGPSVGAACPIIFHADGTIAEAGLFLTPDKLLLPGPERGWTLDSAGPGRSASYVRDVHASAICLMTRRTLLAEFGKFQSTRSPDNVTFSIMLADFALALNSGSLRVVYTPFARAFLAHDGLMVPSDRPRSSALES